jgi:hypothetical protein
MSGQVEQYVTSSKGELTIQIEAKPYLGKLNVIEVTCTINCAQGLIKRMRFLEVRDPN